MRIFALAALLLLSGVASAATIDFEELPEGLLASPTFTSAGYEFNYVGTFNDSWAIGSQQALSWDHYGGLVELSRSDDGVFDLASLDLDSWNNGVTLSVTGYLAEGGTVQLEFLDTVSGFETVTFDSSWVGLTHVEIVANTCCALIDNIVVTAVPVPAAVWLFGSALAGLGLRHRRS